LQSNYEGFAKIAYHSQTNGQPEELNQEIKSIIKNMVNTSRKNWSLCLNDDF